MVVYIGNVVHSTKDTPMLVLTDWALGVQDSKIVFLEEAEKLESLKTKYSFTNDDVIHLSASQFLMPGLVDTHIHAPQYPNCGINVGVGLLQWLKTYTYPTEAMFSQEHFARDVFEKVVDRLLRNGTTTASYYSSHHLEASKILADVVKARGQRALVGKVNMVVSCPEYYHEVSEDESLRETEDFITYVRNLKSPLVEPVITPRFAVCCTGDHMKKLAQLAQRFRCHIQTHLSESRQEVELVKKIYPEAKSYTDVYDTAGLLGDKSIMAHCIWLTDEELQTLKERKVGVSHCPNSNQNLRSGHCDVRKLLSLDIKVGLGTDCSAGYSPSILNSLRCCLDVSNTLSVTHPNHQPLSLQEAFRLATLGGAQVMKMDDKIGNFEPGKEFDALLVDVEAPGSPFDTFAKDTVKEKVEKFLYNGDDRNIMQVLVAGRQVLLHPQGCSHSNGIMNGAKPTVNGTNST